MRRKRHQRGASVLIGAFLLSGVLNLLIAFPARYLADAYLSSGHRRDPVKVVRLSRKAWAESMAQARSAASLRQPSRSAGPGPKVVIEDDPVEDKKDKNRQDKIGGQVVEVPPTADDSPNPDAKYLSEHNTNVKKEMTARPDQRDYSKERVTNKLQQAAPDKPQPESIQTPGIAQRGDGLDQDRPGQAGQDTGSSPGKRFILEVPDLRQKTDGVNLQLNDLPGSVTRNRLARRTPAAEQMRGNADRLRMEMGDAMNNGDGGRSGGRRGDRNGANQPLPSLASLAPTIGTVARISGSPSRDYVEGLPEGEGTFLNTKEFKYATFFYRVRDSVASYWEDLMVREYRRRDPTGNIYGRKDRATLLHIQLNREGGLDSVRVENSSGVDFLDNVAVQAFKMAEPFPNPPTGIMDDDGVIRFNFQFVLTMRANSPLNLFRFK